MPSVEAGQPNTAGRQADREPISGPEKIMRKRPILLLKDGGQTDGKVNACKCTDKGKLENMVCVMLRSAA